MEYTKERPLKVVTLCSGYDSQCLALNRIKQNYSDFEYELIAWAEVDKYAIQAHNVLFPQYADRNMGDITSCDWSAIKSDVDLLVYSTPCQSISCAGKQEGFKEGSGTASSIIWSVLHAIDTLNPKYLLMENVKALVSNKFIGDFRQWQGELAKRGYTNFIKVLDAQNYGVPQHRERVFMVSILDENASFHFPEPFPLDKRLKDVLEEDVDEKYYLSKKIIDTFIERNKINEDKGNGFKFEPTDGDCVASSGLTMPGSRSCDNYIKEPIACAMRGRNPDNPSDRTAGIPTEQRVEVGGDVANCITTVQKDRFVVVPKIIQVANISEEKSFSNPQTGRIYSSEGLCPTLDTMHGGGRQPKIVEPLNSEGDVSRTIKDQYYKNSAANFVRQGTMGATGVIEFSEPLSCAMRGRDLDNPSNREAGCTTGQRIEVRDDVSNTITTVQKDSMVFEPKQVIGSAQKNAYVGDVDGIAPTINAACGMGGGQTPMILGVTVNPNRTFEFNTGHIRQDTCHTLTAQDAKNTSVVWERSKHINYKITENGKIRAYTDDDRKSGVSELQIDNEDAIASTVTTAHTPKCYGESMGFRIRKLTPREVLRLMDVDDADIDKIQAAGISRSQQYKLAGNSIVISCLYHIFRKLFVEKENENKQLTLF